MSVSPRGEPQRSQRTHGRLLSAPGAVRAGKAERCRTREEARRSAGRFCQKLRGAGREDRRRARVSPSKVSCRHTATRASCGSDASRSQLGRRPALGGRRRKTRGGPAEAGTGRRTGPSADCPGAAEPGPPGAARGCCCKAPDGGLRTPWSRTDRPVQPFARRKPAPSPCALGRRYLPNEQEEGSSLPRQTQISVRP